MAASIFLSCILLVNLPCIFLAAENPPVYLLKSYKAIGEIVNTLPDPLKTTFQLAFEEHFDNSTKNAVFTVWEAGTNVSFAEDGLTGQTVKYTNGIDCEVEDSKDWLKIGTSLPGYGYKDGRITFSLRQLFGLDTKYLVESEKAKNSSIRGIPATSWLYNIKQTTEDKKTIDASITVYFSNKDWKTTSRTGVRVPLGYEMKKQTKDANGQVIGNEDFFINVFAFVLDVADRKALAPRENIYCKGRTHPLKFPSFPKWKALSIRSEVIFIDDQEIKNTDIYYDMLNRMLRVDLDRIDSQEIEGDQVTSRRFTSQITSKDLGASFRFDVYRKRATCTVLPIDKYNFDMQEIINPKLDGKLWSLEYILGSNTTNYTYIGKTTKRNIPCHLFQGIRKDWPDQSGDVTSLWEWCLSTDFLEEVNTVRFKDGELGIVSAFVNVTESKNSNIMVGFRMIHHFYDIVQEDPHRLSLTQFDVGQFCFRGAQKATLQFMVNVTIDNDNVHIIDNATSDTTFLRLWRNSIADATDLLISYMRISQIQAFTIGKEVFLSFTLLDIHENLPAEAKKGQPTLKEAQSALQKAVDSGDLTISYLPSAKAKPIPMGAVKGSLANITDKVIDGNTSPIPMSQTSTTPKTTLPIITLISDNPQKTTPKGKTSTSPPVTGTRTSPDGTTTVTGNSVTPPPTTPNPIGDKEPPMEGYAPGSVAGLSIAMLLVGITIGAGGTFYRANGLPCMKR